MEENSITNNLIAKYFLWKQKKLKSMIFQLFHPN